MIAWLRIGDEELRRWCAAVLYDRGHVVDEGDVAPARVDVVVADRGAAADPAVVAAARVVVVDAADDVARAALVAAGRSVVVDKRETALIDVVERTPTHGTAALDAALVELRRKFEVEVPKRVEAITVPLAVVEAGGDAAVVARAAALRAAHVLYGTAGSFGMAALSQACRHIELTLRARAERDEPTPASEARALRESLLPWSHS